MTGSVHLRGIVIAGVLAAVALALGFVTLAMNQTASQAAPRTILPLKARHHVTSVRKTADAATTAGKAGKQAKAKAKVKPKPKPDPNFVAALQGGLPRSVAHALALKPVAVVQLTSKSDPVAVMAAGEAKAGAEDAGVSYVAVSVDGDGGDVEVLTRLIGQLPTAPAALIYTRPAKLVTTLPNFNDRTVIEQAAVSAMPGAAIAAGNTWATKANAICAAGDAQMSALQKQPTVDYTQASAVSRTMIRQLTALKPPAGEATSLGAANALLSRSMKLIDKTHTLAAAKSKAALPTFVSALTLMGHAFVTYNRLGATVCTAAQS